MAIAIRPLSLTFCSLLVITTTTLTTFLTSSELFAQGTGKTPPPPSPPSLPSPPQNVQASDGSSSNSVLITWRAPQGGAQENTYFEILRSSDRSPCSGMTIARVAATSISYTDERVTAGEIFYYSMRTVMLDRSKTGPCSNSDEGFASLAPNAPSNVVASDGQYGDKVVVTWTASAADPVKPVSYYQIFRASSAQACAGQMVQSVPASQTSCEDFSVVPGTVYYYSVKAIGPAGLQSNCSGEIDSGFAALAPSITNFTPTQAAPGETVTINGQNFGAGRMDNVVLFSAPQGTVQATVNTSTPTTLQVVVPIGASTGPISVATAGGMATSRDPFVALLLHEDFENGAPGWTMTGTPLPDALWHIAAPNIQCGHAGTSKRVEYNRGDEGTCNYKTGFASNSGNLISSEFVVLNSQIIVSGVYTKLLDAAADNISISLLDTSTTTDFVAIIDSELPNTTTPTAFSKLITLPPSVVGHTFKLHIFFAADGVGNNGFGATFDDIVGRHPN